MQSRTSKLKLTSAVTCQCNLDTFKAGPKKNLASSDVSIQHVHIVPIFSTYTDLGTCATNLHSGATKLGFSNSKYRSSYFISLTAGDRLLDLRIVEQKTAPQTALYSLSVLNPF